MAGNAESILVLGIGNSLCGDDAFGIQAQHRLAHDRALPDGVTVMDGGTQGIYLLPHIQAAERLLLLDAVDLGRPPGELVLLRDGEIPSRLCQGAVSAHQSGVPQLLSLAGLLGWVPRAVALVGVQVRHIGLGLDMAPEVAARVDEAVALAVAVLAEWRCRTAGEAP